MRRICSWLKSQGVQGAAASVVLLIAAAAGAMAATPAPAPDSLPADTFTASQPTTYNGSGSTAKIATEGGNVILQWGGSPQSNTPTGNFLVTNTNQGFSIGSGANLTITNSSGAVLVNDLSDSSSQIYGTLIASGVDGPLYIANARGVIVGSTGMIMAPSDGVGLLGYMISDTSPFDGTVSISKSQATSGGAVTVQSGAKITGGLLLVAGTGTVNVALPNTSIYMSGSGEASDVSSITTCEDKSCTTTTSGVYALAGEAFNTGVGSVAPLPVVTVTSPPPHHPH